MATSSTIKNSSTPMWLATLALVAAMFSFQIGASVAKHLFPAVGAQGAAALRVCLGAVMLAAVLRPWRKPVTRGTAGPLLVYGLALGLMNTLFYMALRTVPLGVAIALEFLGPLSVATMSLRRPLDFAWTGLAVIGLLLLLPLRQSVRAIDPVGAGLALGAGACWAVYMIAGQRAGASHGPQAVAWGSIVAACVAGPIGYAHAGTALFDPAILPLALLMAALSSALPYVLEMMALTGMPARAYATITCVDPGIGALLGLLLLGEALSPGQWIGIAAVAVAAAGTTAERPARVQEVEK